MKSHLEVYSLADEKKTSVDRDIEAFLKEELPDLVSSLVEDASDWPGDEKRKALVLKSQGLFIFASTAVRIIADPDDERDPDAALERILSSDRHSPLDEIYKQIIERACPSAVSSKVIGLFREVLGALVVAREPINIHTLGSLLCPDGQQLRDFISHIRLKVLRYLQAVLVIPGVNSIEQAADAQPIQFIHTSFVDYLTEIARSESRLIIHLASQHERLAIACFRLMQSLTRNVCDLDPDLLNSEVKDLSQRVRERIPPALQYACLYVAAHVCQTAVGSVDVCDLVARFAGERLMYWLEVISLMGRTHGAVGMVASIESWLKAPRVDPALAPLDDRTTLQGVDKLDDLTCLSLLYDFRRFILEFMEPIVASTLHIYLSALALMPLETGLSRQYGHLTRGGVKVVRGRAKQWSRTLWTVTKFSYVVSDVAMSPDGTTIVSASGETLRLWDVKTGEAIGEAMKGHTDRVNCVAISPDGTTIVSGSDDKTLQLWDAKTGEAIGRQ
ncbi:POC1 centriolar protein A [Tulasnella sp. JGI-2019a]|nr:POC1 centriolar protein A [Tulasnella sp. JGI-2019a]